MRERGRQDDRLYWWKIAAGLVTTVYLTGLLVTALLRETNHSYAPVVGVLLVGVVVGVAVSVVRRFRAWLHRPPRSGGALEDAVASAAKTAGVAGTGLLLARRAVRKGRS